MAQAYLHQKTASSPLASPILEAGMAEKQINAENVQEAFINLKNGLLHAIDDTKSILNNFREFTKNEWVIRYPAFGDEAPKDAQEAPLKRPSLMRRSMTFLDDPSTETEVILTSRKGQSRSLSLASVKDAREEDVASEVASFGSSKADLGLRVLHLDLKMGHYGSSSTAQSLASQLEKDSIARLLVEKMGAALKHVDKLRIRVLDTSSKVLITGDLNAGKSTLVNALLRREVMPVDQQPCTTAFCEVHDAAENDGKEEVHVLTVSDATMYSPKDERTYTRMSLEDLDDLISDNEDSQQMVKVYINDPRQTAESFLNNGIVDISLIDAPGLNRDSVKTTELFARQEEIDVVVFVVSAENHFTLSAREFLENASKEKAYLFIVVNKFESIRNKEKCKRRVLEQIKELSPRTYEDNADLVHFVDSASVLGVHPSSPAFGSLESSLRSFVLLKRTKSKLHPAATYLTHLLADMDLLAGSNAILAKAELEKARDDLSRARPVLEKMKNGRSGLEESLEQVEEDKTVKASLSTTDTLSKALDRVGSGELAVENTIISLPTYPGLLRIWDYVHDVRKALLASLDAAVKLAEDETRMLTTEGVKDINALGDRFLPEGVERSRRVFMPEAMFARHHSGRNGRARRGSNGAIVAGGLYGLGIGLVQRPDLLEPSFLDIFDVTHHYHTYFGQSDSKDLVVSDKDDEHIGSALGIMSIALGGLSMVGGKALGVTSIIEGASRLSDLFGNETARKWAAPVLGAVTIGLGVYLVIELPSSVPRTVGRRVRAALIRADEKSGVTFVGAHASRVARETRKVLRLAAYEQRERFRAAMESSLREVQSAERIEHQAGKALAWFDDVQIRTGNVRKEVEAIGDL
ncbi:FZO1 [Sanghuangporus weigelae]